MTRIFFAIGLLLTCCGCSSQESYGPTGSIQGRLTFEGQPLQSGTLVMFMQPQKGYLAFGGTNAEGQFLVSSWNDGKMPVGRYEVMIQPPPVNDPSLPKEGDEPADNLQWKATLVATADFPTKYRLTSTSGLAFEVHEGVNTIDIDLKKSTKGPAERARR